jgi:L-lactate dehydrogenase complex protein LldG
MSARESILARIARGAPTAAPHPGAFESRLQASAWSDFTAMATRAGSLCEGPIEPVSVGDHVRRWVQTWGGGRVVAQPGCAQWREADGVEIASADAPAHSFADVAVGVVRAELAVAENGALAIPGANAPQRALLYLCQRLIVLVPAARVVPHMHAAVDALGDEIGAGPCFSWMAGPSKTADIEQELVVGAHGPRALTILGLA